MEQNRLHNHCDFPMITRSPREYLKHAISCWETHAKAIQRQLVATLRSILGETFIAMGKIITSNTRQTKPNSSTPYCWQGPHRPTPSSPLVTEDFDEMSPRLSIPTMSKQCRKVRQNYLLELVAPSARKASYYVPIGQFPKVNILWLRRDRTTKTQTGKEKYTNEQLIVCIYMQWCLDKLRESAGREDVEGIGMRTPAT